jgi:hypothetical protein
LSDLTVRIDLDEKLGSYGPHLEITVVSDSDSFVEIGRCGTESILLYDEQVIVLRDALNKYFPG